MKIKAVYLQRIRKLLLPETPGETSELLNLARMLGGFSVAYYQVPCRLDRGCVMRMSFSSQNMQAA